MTETIDDKTIEAGDPTTSPERLRQLSEERDPNEYACLKQLIAANPNADDELLMALAADFPKEVIGNPSFQFGEAWRESCELRSLCSLALAMGEDAPPSLKSALTSRFQEIYIDYSEKVSISSQESWRYARSVKILADESDGHAPFDIDLEINLEILMEGRSTAQLSSNEDGTSFSRDWVTWLLEALHNKSITSLLETFDPFAAGMELDITLKEAGELLQLTTTNSKIKIRDSSIVLTQTGETLFDVNAYYQSNEEALLSFIDGELQVPIFEHVGDGSRRRVSRDHEDSLGVLEPFWGWEPEILAAEVHKDYWIEWLGELISE
jgi:hypothetical protein